ncbi:hypothetical protein KRP22_014892 [Phytophthora ramorum]|nr:hypothetical protein KRP23_11865 [Phytophthora ramorum]KAH7496159.1 hypothetical protein KRP22_14053 [Phytophthora ramorum]
MSSTYGPPMAASIALAVVACAFSAFSIYMAAVRSARKNKVVMASLAAERKLAAASEPAPTSESGRDSHLVAASKTNYHQNFV